MSLFACDTCNHIENTAPGDYWRQSVEQSRLGVPRSQRKFECSLCRTGTWHGLFERTEYDGSQDVKNRGNSGPRLPNLPGSG